MSLRFRSFANAGDPARERLVLKAFSDFDVGSYIVICSPSFKDGLASAGNQRAYWFPDGEVKQGDLVVLYSKSGVNGKKKLERGGTAHFYYWGLENPVWGDAKHVAVLIKSLTWTQTNPESPESDSG